MTFIALFFIGLTSWLIATLTAGGAGMIYLVLAGTLLSLPLAVVTLGIAGMITGAYRVWVYRHDISRDITPFLLTGTVIGASIGATLFGIVIATQYLHALQISLALFLIISGAIGLCRRQSSSLKPRLYWFLPMGLCTGLISGLIGAVGPVMNGLFQAFALQPQQIVGTKALNIFVQQLIKAIVYILTLGFSSHEALLKAGLELETVLLCSFAAAAGGAAGVYSGRRILGHMHHHIFNTVLNLSMLLYGLHILHQIYRGTCC